jgi:acetyltransferase EpsM
VSVKQAILWGASGHALVVADIVRSSGKFQLIGLLDDIHEESWGTTIKGLPVLGGADRLPELRAQGVKHLIVAIGDCQTRLRLAEIARKQDFELATAIHPSAIITQDVLIGPGTVVAPGAIVNAASRIGANVIVNTGAIIEHESTIEDGVHICPGVRLAGNVSVGRGTWIGIGSVVIEKIRIGAGSYLGAGSIVVTDIPDGVVAYGVPARIIREVPRDE